MKTLLFALAALSLVGCKQLGVRPAGPLAKTTPLLQSDQPLPPATVAASKVPAIQPTPPTMYVAPGDVNASTADAVVQKFAAELAEDSKRTANAPVTVEVSKVGRVKP